MAVIKLSIMFVLSQQSNSKQVYSNDKGMTFSVSIHGCDRTLRHFLLQQCFGTFKYV